MKASRGLISLADGAVGNEPAVICRSGEVEQGYHYWSGASGRRYLHTVFPLLECPEVPEATYIIVAHDLKGAKQALEIGQTWSDTASLNRAYLRHRAAQLGAIEIHVHVLAETLASRNSVVADLRARHNGLATDHVDVAKAS